MALDKNLFTLNIEQSKIEPNAVDLVDPSGVVHYRKRILPNETGAYLFSLSDPLSDSLLATATAPSVTSKEKVIELHNPSAVVPLSFKGTLTFKWDFVWEEHHFQWKREACYMIRKPDPPVLVAITKEPPGKIKTSIVQILDYNLNRFDVEDRKGLEIVLLTSLLTFSDQSEQMRAKPGEASSTPPMPNTPPAAPVAPPPRPPKPDGWGDQIAILQAKEQHEVNEVVVGDAGTVEEYAKHCISLLNDDTLLFITLRSHSPNFVSKVVQVAEATKRTRYKSGAWDEELHQYVSTPQEDSPTGQGKAKGPPPRVINLNDGPNAPVAPANAYIPPASLTIHLSKIAMPELEPKAKKPQQAPNPGGHSKKSSESKEQRSGKKPSAALTKPPRPVSPTQQQSGLRAKLFPSRSSSPPPGPRPSSAPHSTRQPSRSPGPHTQTPPHSRIPSNSHTRPSHTGGPSHPPHASVPPHLPPHAYSYPTGPAPSNFRPGPGPLNAPPGNPMFVAHQVQYASPAPPQTSTGGFLDKFMRR